MRGDLSLVEALVDRTRALARSESVESLRAALPKALAEYDPGVDEHNPESASRLVSEVFARLFPMKSRPNGQVETPTWAAQVMAGWVLADGRDRGAVLDAGCGTGVLMAAAASQSSDVSLIGIDIDPVAVELTRQTARLGGFTADVMPNDFLLDAIDIRPSGVLCNPPYVRHHDRTAHNKDAVAQAIGQRLGVAYTRTASLHALFLARAVEISAPGARLAFITPAHWLNTRYGRAVTEYVRMHASVIAVIQLGPKFFPNVRTSAAITLLARERARTRNFARIAVRDPEQPPRELVESIRSARSTTTARAYRSPAAEFVGDLARVRRGVATGHNRFFVLSERQRRSHHLPMSAVRPCIASPRHFGAHTLGEEDLEALSDNIPRWLLTVGPQHSAAAVKNYLKHGVELGVPNRRLARDRDPWYQIKWTGTSPIILSYLNTGNPRVVLNRAGAVPLNNWLRLEPHDPSRTQELFERLSTEEFTQTARARGKDYGQGLWKLEPSDVARLELPVA